MIGPGGVGKTSLLNGLKNKPLPPANSTQLAKTSTVKPQSWSRATGEEDSPWTDVSEEDETDEIVGLVQLVKNVNSGQTSSSRFVAMVTAAVGAAMQLITNRSNASGYQNEVKETTEEILSRAVSLGKKNPNAQAPDSEVMLHVWDCGGQPVFLDVLPPFLTSRTMFMLVFDASRNLHENCVATSHQDGTIVQLEQYHDATTLDLLLQWMATIHANLAKQHSIYAKKNVPKFPRILPIGTHGDLPSVQAQKKEILDEIASECVNKAFAYLLRPGAIVNNMTAGSGENEDPAFKEVRREAYQFADKVKIRTPITWVLFRKVFKKLAAKKPIFLLQEVIEIAKACGVREEAVESVLKFYHELAVFFHYAQIPSLKQYVIADVQWLINHLAKVIALEGFEEGKSPLLWKPLQEKGILLQSLCEEVWENSELPTHALLQLMENFLLLAPIHEKVYPHFPGEEYFIPSVLKPFNEGKDTVEPITALKKAAPLHLRFNTLYIPPGFFSRLATLLAKERKCHVLFEHKVYRNRISIFYGEANNQIDMITISQLSSSIQIEVIREQPRLPQHPLFSTICREILKLIQECSVSILEWLPGIVVSPAFVCEHQSSDEGRDPPHFIEFQADATTRSSLRCMKLHPVSLSQGRHYWLKISSKEKGLCHSPLSLSELNHLASQVPPDKIKELVECLEMTSHLLAEVVPDFQTVLERWCKEMEEMDAPNLRAHLVHHLRVIDLKGLAERVKFGEIVDTRASNSDKDMKDPLIPLTEADLLQCSRFMTESTDLSLLATMLNISDAELESICSRYKKLQGQAYQVLHTWFSKTQSQNKRQDLLAALNATNFTAAAKRLEQTIKAPTLADLLKYVTTAKWFQLGVCLGLNTTKLAMIDQDCNKTEEKLTQMFQTWLEVEKDPTWNKITQALDELGLKVLASDLKEKFCAHVE